MTAHADGLRVVRPGGVAGWLRRGLRRQGSRRTVPAAVLDGTELIHLGGGESLPCPGIDRVPLAASARALGLGSAALALPPARAHVLRDATICATSRLVLAPDGRIVAESLTADMVGRVGPSESELSSPPVELDGTVALFRSPWRPYFHTLIDHLPRAALLAQPAMRRLGPITLVHDGPLSPIEQYLLERLLPERVRVLEVEPGRSVRAARIVVPGYVTRPASGAIPSWYRRWVDRAAAAARSDPEHSRPPRRIFIDRVHSPRRVMNRAELAPVLEHHGVEVVEPSELAPADEIALFRDAELVVGVTGSGLANCLFSRGAHVVELVPGAEVLPHFFYLATAKGLPYDYVVSPPDRQRLGAVERLQRDVVVDAAALDRLLAGAA